MGGKSKTTTGTTPTGTTAPVPGQSNMMTIPGSMPGQLDAISQQLGAAYGQDPAAFMSIFQQLHAPMQVQNPATSWTPPGGTAASMNPGAGKTRAAPSYSSRPRGM